MYMYVSYNWDPEICPLYQGVHYRGVSIKRGFTVYVYTAKIVIIMLSNIKFLI